LIAAIDRLNSPEGRDLRKIAMPEKELIGGILADTQLLDAQHFPRRTISAGGGLASRHLAKIAGSGSMVRMSNPRLIGKGHCHHAPDLLNGSVWYQCLMYLTLLKTRRA
jgi:hypothetical protein